MTLAHLKRLEFESGCSNFIGWLEGYLPVPLADEAIGPFWKAMSLDEKSKWYFAWHNQKQCLLYCNDGCLEYLRDVIVPPGSFFFGETQAIFIRANRLNWEVSA